MALSNVRALLVAASLSLVGTLGCSGGVGVDVSDRRERSALVDATVDAETTGVVAVFLAARGQRLFQCSGALVAPDVVLTAGHCALAFDPDATTRAAACEGDSEPQLAAPEDIVVASGLRADQSAYGVERIVVPSSSEGRVTGLCGQDIALLVLKEPVPQREAKALDLRLTQETRAGETIDTVGFGADDPLAIPLENVRRRATGSVQCVAAGCELDDVRDGEWLSEDVFACAGDSGAPALDEAGKIVGVVSRSFRDCHSVVYGDVFSLRDFFERELAAARVNDPDHAPSGAEREPVSAGCALGIDRDPRRRAPQLPVFLGVGLVSVVLSRRLSKSGERTDSRWSSLQRLARWLRHEPSRGSEAGPDL